VVVTREKMNIYEKILGGKYFDIKKEKVQISHHF
jgi:hypothetical protein